MHNTETGKAFIPQVFSYAPSGFNSIETYITCAENVAKLLCEKGLCEWRDANLLMCTKEFTPRVAGTAVSILTL